MTYLPVVNDILHQLTTLGAFDLYVLLKSFNGDWYYAKYSDFRVAEEFWLHTET